MDDYKPTRSQVITNHTRDAIDATTLTWRALAIDVVTRYHNATAPQDRTVKFNNHKDSDTRAKHWAQELGRMVKNEGGMRIPADLEEHMVEALPEPYRSDCKAELVRRMGLLPAPMIDIKQGGAVGSLASTVKEFSEMLAVLGEITADGSVDEKDRPQLKRAFKESNDVLAQIVAWQREFTELLDDGPEHNNSLRAIK